MQNQVWPSPRSILISQFFNNDTSSSSLVNLEDCPADKSVSVGAALVIAVAALVLLIKQRAASMRELKAKCARLVAVQDQRSLAAKAESITPPQATFAHQRPFEMEGMHAAHEMSNAEK